MMYAASDFDQIFQCGYLAHPARSNEVNENFFSIAIRFTSGATENAFDLPTEQFQDPSATLGKLIA
jgi:hypothetical protein